ncbi:MAG: hypothetical protein RSB98_02930 [Raoultibacter sp.]
MAKFNSKTFNPQAFGKYVDTIPKVKRNELVKSKVLQPNSQIRSAFRGQTGVVYATIPMYGRIGGTPINYDGVNDITATNTTTYERGVVVIGRAKAWTEKDFAEDVTGGAGFMSHVGRQVTEYWDEIDQNTLLSILKGIFSMAGTENLKFVNGHSYDISNQADKNVVAAPTLNSAIQKASGDKKSKFGIVIMHSVIATNLENLQLLSYMTYNDANGIQRQLSLATWNGRVVLIDDGMPATEGYFDAESVAAGALKVVASGATGAQVNLADATPYFGAKTLAANDYVVKGVQYTTYIFGEGAFDFEDIGAEVPYEMQRDPKTNGGLDTLYSRQRKVFAPYGISFTKSSMSSNSPTDTELETATNWTLVNDGNGEYIDHKSIAIARIMSRG